LNASLNNFTCYDVSNLADYLRHSVPLIARCTELAC
jgi:hypothetical protein